MTKDVNLQVLASEETRNAALQFAAYLMTKKIQKQTFAGHVEEYTPKEFDLILGNILIEGDSLYAKYVKDVYGVEAVYKLKQ